MDSETRQKIKQAIETKMAETRQSIASLKEQTKPIAPDNSLGRITRMDAINQKSVYEANLRSAEELLLNLESSLVRVDDENFGVCDRCHQPIPVERLLAIPESTRCIQCVGRIW